MPPFAIKYTCENMRWTKTKSCVCVRERVCVWLAVVTVYNWMVIWSVLWLYSHIFHYYWFSPHFYQSIDSIDILLNIVAIDDQSIKGISIEIEFLKVDKNCFSFRKCNKNGSFFFNSQSNDFLKQFVRTS